jgi:hypothetical protein
VSNSSPGRYRPGLPPRGAAFARIASFIARFASKNWVHIGSPMAGPRVAAVLSVTEACRRLGIPVREYLASVLPGLAYTGIQTLARLTPAAWAACNC